MMIILKKTYTITVTIQEGNDEFWEELEGRTGCDEVVAEVKSLLDGFGSVYVRLAKFSEEP